MANTTLAFAKQSITLDTTQRILDAARRKAVEIGVPSTIVVVDEAGLTKAVLRMDHARPLSFDAATRKAYTSVALSGADTDQFAHEIEKDTRLLAVFAAYPNLALLSGGLPLRIGDELIGAIGVSGGSDPQDLQVAQAGAAELQTLLRNHG